jgi:hypothetical protein
MAEILALEKHACPACGAQAEWNPGKQKLVCPFCGTESPYAFSPATGEIAEIDLVRTLREMPDELRGWKADKRTVQCQSCKAVMVFDPERVGQNCEFCGSPALVDYGAIKAPIRPQSVLPFRVSQSQVRETIRAWYASKWLAPNAFSKRALIDRVHSVYLPYWTFDAHVRCPWRAEAGHYYYTNETYRDSNGRRQTRRVRHVRWEPASGVVTHVFDDVPIAGSQGVARHLLAQIEPFPTHELVAYDTGYLSGHVVEHYQVVLVDAAQQSREAMTTTLRELCTRQIPGDTSRNLQIFPEWSGETFKHVLLPVWLLTYNYGPRAFQLVVNGYTGRIAGDYPKSPWKIFFIVLVVLVFVLLVLMAGN